MHHLKKSAQTSVMIYGMIVMSALLACARERVHLQSSRRELQGEVNEHYFQARNPSETIMQSLRQLASRQSLIFATMRSRTCNRAEQAGLSTSICL